MTKSSERRHRFFIRVLKIGLPLIALGVFASFFIFNGARFDDRVSFDGVDVSSLDEGLRLTNPHFTGATKKGEPFTVTADWALPDGPRPEEVELSGVKGEIILEDGRELAVTAPGGMLVTETSHVSLNGGVTLVTSDGYTITSDTAALDPKAEKVEAGGGVTVEMAPGTITSENMRATRSGDPGEGAYIWFENRVKVHIQEPGMSKGGAGK